MARCSTFTKLSLDRFALLMGINPVHFNGGNEIYLADGRKLFPIENSQNNVWPQYSWQNADQTSREELGQLIYQCESEIEKVIGRNCAKDWTVDEEYYFEGYHRPEVMTVPNVNMRNGEWGVVLGKDKFIAPGIRKVTSIALKAPVTYTDPDADGWDEKANIDVDISAFVALRPDYSYRNIKFYFEGHSADRDYEIRPLIYEYIDGLNVLHAKFNTWMMIDPVLTEAFPDDDTGGKAINLQDPANLVTEVDIYYEENDPTQTSAKFYSFNSTTGLWDMQTGYITQPKYSDNFVALIPANYVNGSWSPTNTCGTFSKVSLSYYSGDTENENAGGRNLGGFKTNDPLKNIYSQAISNMAVARLERVYYANTNATSVAERLRVDMAETNQQQQFFLGSDLMSNPFGTRVGEIKAWKVVSLLMKRKAGVALL